MRSLIRRRVLGLSALMLIALLIFATPVSMAAAASTTVHAGTAAGVQHPDNIVWD